MYQPLVSVIVPTFEGRDTIEETLYSILAQTYSNLEVLVVDDDSPDDTAQFVQMLSREDARVRYLHQQNAGTAAARNTGLRAARGELIALLDHDDLWLPNRLAAQVPLLENPEIGLVHAGIEFFVEENGVQRVTYKYFPGENVGLVELLSRTPLGVQTLLFQRELLDTLGGFDETLKGTDDWDICIRVAAVAGVVGLPQTLGRVRVHASQQSRDGRQMFLNAMKVVEKSRHFGASNNANRQALREAETKLRQEYAESLKTQAKTALKGNAKWNSIGYLAHAFMINPKLLKKVVKNK